MSESTTTSPLNKIKQPKPLPAPNCDFYELAETLPAEELAVLKQVRAFMEKKVAPIITKYWVEDAFPFELIPAVKDLNIGGSEFRATADEAEARCSSACWRWSWRVSTPRSRRWSRTA
jgi:hypothetical protein